MAHGSRQDPAIEQFAFGMRAPGILARNRWLGIPVLSPVSRSLQTDTIWLPVHMTRQSVCGMSLRDLQRIAATHALGSLVYLLSFSPTSNCLVSGFNDGTLRFWNINSGNLEQIGEAIHGHSGIVWSVAFSPDGLSVASGSEDKSIKIWMVPTTSTRPPGTSLTDYIHGIPLTCCSSRGQDYGNFSERSSFKFLDLDRRGNPVLSDTSYIDEGGWMRDSRGENRDGSFGCRKKTENSS